jgi:hypothetical protein
MKTGTMGDAGNYSSSGIEALTGFGHGVFYSGPEDQCRVDVTISVEDPHNSNLVRIDIRFH